MNRLLMSTAIVGLAALPGFAIAQSDQADDTMTQAQTETDSRAETGTGTEAGTGKETGAKAGSGTDMGATSQTGSDDSKADSSKSGSTASGGAGSSDMGSDDMMSGNKPSVTEGHSEVDPSTVEASEVEGAPVMSRDGEEIADVSEVLLTEDGSIDSIVVNVGGVLGIGSKPVEIPFDEVTLQTKDEDDEMSIIIPMSQQDLEDMPEYEEG